MNKKFWVGLLCMVFTLMLFDNLLAQERQQRRPQRRRPRWTWKGPELGTAIKDFELPVLEGCIFKLSDQKGKIVIIELGACT